MLEHLLKFNVLNNCLYVMEEYILIIHRGPDWISIPLQIEYDTINDSNKLFMSVDPHTLISFILDRRS